MQNTSQVTRRNRLTRDLKLSNPSSSKTPESKPFHKTVRATMNKRLSILNGPNTQWDTIPVRSYSLSFTTRRNSNIRHPVIEGMGSILPNFIIHTQGSHIPSVSQITHKCCITNDTIQQDQMRLSDSLGCLQFRITSWQFNLTIFSEA